MSSAITSQMPARVLTGGHRRDDLGGYFFEPTVLVDVNSSMKVMTEETFGPVLPIKVVKDETQAIHEANCRSSSGIKPSRERIYECGTASVSPAGGKV